MVGSVLLRIPIPVRNQAKRSKDAGGCMSCAAAFMVFILIATKDRPHAREVFSGKAQ
jgi:hypothetical protein